MTYKRKSGLSTAIILLLAAALVAGVLAVMICGCSDRDVKARSGAGEAAAETMRVEANNAEVRIPPAAGGLRLAGAGIDPARYEEYGVSPTAENAYTLTATLSPEAATNKSVDWSVAWTDATSEWADGKDVTEYISLSPSGLTCTVTCLRAFGEQATLKCSWAEDEDINAVCTLEYAERIVSLEYEHNEIAYSFTSSGSSYEYAGESGEYDAFGYGIEPVYGDGTLTDTFSYGYFVSFSSELVEAMREQGFETYEPDMAYNIEKKMNEEYFGASGALFGLFVLTDDSARQVVSDKLSGASGGAYDRFAGVMRSLAGERLFSIDVVCTGEYSGFTGTCDFSAQASVYATDVTDIRLSDGSVIF